MAPETASGEHHLVQFGSSQVAEAGPPSPRYRCPELQAVIHTSGDFPLKKAGVSQARFSSKRSHAASDPLSGIH